MPDEDELGIMEEFEWALKDPTEEKIRQLGEVVSTITAKLVAAISEMQENIFKIQDTIRNLEAKVDRLEARGVPAGGAAAASTASSSAPAPVTSAPKPPPRAPAAAGGGRGGFMAEIKAALEARRRKAAEE